MASQSKLAEETGTFDVLRLPVELRYKIWEEILLDDDPDEVDDWPLPAHAEFLRWFISGFYRPYALLKLLDDPASDAPSWSHSSITRVPALFLVSKAIAAEAREIAYSRVLVEIHKRNNHPQFSLSRLADHHNHPVLKSLHILHICAGAKVTSDQKWRTSTSRISRPPELFFDCLSMPLFKVEVDMSNGAWLVLYAQRHLIKQHAESLNREILRWLENLDSNHHFDGPDLFKIASIIARVQTEGRFLDWGLLHDAMDEVKREAEAAEYAKVRKPLFRRALSRLKYEWRAPILKLNAPYLRQS